VVAAAQWRIGLPAHTHTNTLTHTDARASTRTHILMQAKRPRCTRVSRKFLFFLKVHI